MCGGESSPASAVPVTQAGFHFQKIIQETDPIVAAIVVVALSVTDTPHGRVAFAILQVNGDFDALIDGSCRCHENAIRRD